MNNALGLDFNNLLTGFYPPTIAQIIMILLGAYLIYMSIYYKKKPLLLLPMGVAILAANMPLPKLTEDVVTSFLGFLHSGADSGVYPVLVFFAVGTMIDLGLVLADPKNFFIGASSQIGILIVFYIMSSLNVGEGLSAATSIIGAADGALAMYMSSLITEPKYFAAIVMAAYLYMELLPILQSTLTKVLTTSIKPLEQLVFYQKEFKKAYQEYKQINNLLDFNDLEANALKILEPQYGIVDLLYHQLKEIMSNCPGEFMNYIEDDIHEDTLGEYIKRKVL